MRRNEIFREVLGLALMAFTAFAVLSLFTFDPADISALQCPPNVPVHNLGGDVGAQMAFRVFYLFGHLAAWALTLLMGLWGFVILLRRKLPNPAFKLGGGVLFLMALAVVECLVGLDGTSALPAGGIVGTFLIQGVLLAGIGKMGTVLLVLYVSIISLLLVTDFLFYDAIADSVGFVRRFHVGQMKGLIPFLSHPNRHVEERRGRETAASQDHEVDIETLEEEALARREHRLRHERFMDIVKVSATPDGASSAVAVADPPVQTQDDVQEKGDRLSPADDEEEEIELQEQEVEGEEDREEEETESSPDEEKPLAPPAKSRAKKSGNEYVLPPSDLLKLPMSGEHVEPRFNVQRAHVLENTLASFRIDAKVVGIVQGPTITQFEIQLKSGIRVSLVTKLANDLAIAMKAESVRVVPNLPGKGTIGVEVPNAEKGIVLMRDLIEAPEYTKKKWKLPLFLGKDAAGTAVIADLSDMPHMLIAGSTGSGKSICVNTLLTSLLMTKRPDEVKFILIDPKRVEMAPFTSVPHLMTPVVTNMKKAAVALDNLVSIMEERYAIFEKVGVRQLSSYNRLKKKEVAARLDDLGLDPDAVQHPLPYIVVVVDELSDLMMVGSKDVETSIIRLAQKSRAVGIHLVLSTQRPSSDVITGLIKSNMPSRIAFRVTSGVESRVILDSVGAEKLLGKGDMLYQHPGNPDMIRSQGTYIDDDEIATITHYLSKIAKPEFSDSIVQLEGSGVDAMAEEDEFFLKAGDLILESGRASTTMLQRAFQVGYTRASRIIDQLSKVGLVGKFRGSKAREIVWSFEEWEAFKEKLAKN
jgi:S-DNA-T family DNA segregation ATPase FtsK/SpoIIIE